MKRKHDEAILQHAIIEYLACLQIVAWRQNTGAGKTPSGRLIRFGVPGQADITGIMPNGTRLEIECKSPRGVQSTAQRNYESMIRAHHGVYILARSVDDVHNALFSDGEVDR